MAMKNTFTEIDSIELSPGGAASISASSAASFPDLLIMLSQNSDLAVSQGAAEANPTVTAS